MVSVDKNYQLRTSSQILNHPRKYAQKEELARIVKNYNLELEAIHTHIPIEGSPERSLFRTVFEDIQKHLYILEKISPHSVAQKTAVAKTLDFLKLKGLPQIQPYIRNKTGEHILHRKNQYWQIIPYIESIALQRPEYVYDQWRGKLFATFLINLKKTSARNPFFKKSDIFCIKEYIIQLMASIKKHKSALIPRFEPIWEYLNQDYLKHADSFPVTFCHGDFHPLNILWSENKILGVIDWEFAGYKTEIYDVANMIGCIGIEDPNSLTGPLVIEMIKTLKGANLYSPKSWDYLLDAIIAQRFAWLSEWLRKNDIEMQEMEEDYLNLLIAKKEIIYSSWNNLKSTDEESIYV